MVIAACPTPEALPVATRGHYLVEPPELTTLEILNRLARRLLTGEGEFSYKWEMARHRCYVQVTGMLEREKTLAQLDAQRAALAALHHTPSPKVFDAAAQAAARRRAHRPA